MIMDIYARISQDKRIGTELEGLNVDQQIERCKTWIRERGHQVGTVYRDDSISATSGVKRDAFEQMLLDEPRPVVYWIQSRLERHPWDLDRFLLSQREGYGTDGSRITLENASAELSSRMMSLINLFEQKRKSELQKEANLRMAKAGRYRSSIRPFGQYKDGTIHPEEAKAVRTAAENLISGKWTFYRIAEYWNSLNLHTPHSNNARRKEWTGVTVRNYFTRPRLYGYQEYEGVLYKLSNWNPLLTKDEFDTIQLIIDSRRTGKRGYNYGRKDAHLLTSIVKCECGRGMNIGYRGGKGSAKIYRCPTTKHQTVVAKPLEEHVARQVLETYQFNDSAQEQHEQNQQDLMQLQREKAQLVKDHNQWLAEAGAAGTSPIAMRAREDAHAEKLAGLEEKLHALQREQGLSIFATLEEESEGGELAAWNRLTTTRQRELVKSLYKEIRVARGGQGQRFNTDRVSFVPTPFAEKLIARGIEYYDMEEPATPELIEALWKNAESILRREDHS